MRIKVFPIVFSVLFAGTGLFSFGDCGSIPFSPVLNFPFAPIDTTIQFLEDMMDRTDLSYDPLKVRVFEPAQRAVILWNGQEEILLLSTDQSATERSAILEVIPLPSEPRVRLGSLETFEAAHRLVVEKRMWACAHGGARADRIKVPRVAGRITFSEKLGPHDITVAQVLSDKGFIEFVQSYLQEKYQTPQAPIRPEFARIIQAYIEKDFDWFCFDVILLDPSPKTREPIEYRFQSDRVFYPLTISALEQGKTRVNLLVFTPKLSATFEGIERSGVEQDPPVTIKPEEAEGLERGWKGFFNGIPGVVMHQWKIEGDMNSMTKDVIVR